MRRLGDQGIGQLVHRSAGAKVRWWPGLARGPTTTAIASTPTSSDRRSRTCDRHGRVGSRARCAAMGWMKCRLCSGDAQCDCCVAVGRFPDPPRPRGWRTGRSGREKNGRASGRPCGCGLWMMTSLRMRCQCRTGSARGANAHCVGNTNGLLPLSLLIKDGY